MPQDELTRDELYERAKVLDIDGRTNMDKAELAAAVAAAEASADAVADQVLEEAEGPEEGEDLPPVENEDGGAVDAEESQDGAPAEAAGPEADEPSEAAAAGEAANKVADEVLDETPFDEVEENEVMPGEGSEIAFMAGGVAVPAKVVRVYNRHLVDLVTNPESNMERLRRGVAYDAARATGTWSWPEGE